MLVSVSTEQVYWKFGQFGFGKNRNFGLKEQYTKKDNIPLNI